MKGAAIFFMACMIPMTQAQTAGPGAAPGAPAHVSNSFQLVIRVPMRQAAPLFGPEGERCWAGKHWDPQFFYPQPAEDIEGSVFTVQHGPYTSVWVNTLFDLSAGRMHYVSFIPAIMVTTVDVRLTALDTASTTVHVKYERTALTATANDEVQTMGKSDGESGPQWQQAIEHCLATRAAQ